MAIIQLVDGECELTTFTVRDLRTFIEQWSSEERDLADIICDLLTFIDNAEECDVLDFHAFATITVDIMKRYIKEMSIILDLVYNARENPGLYRLVYFGDDPCYTNLLREYSSLPDEERDYHKMIADTYKEMPANIVIEQNIFSTYFIEDLPPGTKMRFDEVDKICIGELFYGIMYRYYLEKGQIHAPSDTEPGTLALAKMREGLEQRNPKSPALALIDELRQHSNMAEHIENGGAETIPIFHEYYKLIYRLLDDESIEYQSYMKSPREIIERGVMNMVINVTRHWRVFMMFRVLFTLVLGKRKMEDVIDHINMVYATGSNAIAIFDINRAYMAFNTNFPHCRYALDEPVHVLALCA